MPYVEQSFSEAELREQIARLTRLSKANPAMARDFDQRVAAARKQLNALLLDQGGYSVTKDAEIEARISAARAEGHADGLAEAKAAAEAALNAER